MPAMADVVINRFAQELAKNLPHIPDQKTTPYSERKRRAEFNALPAMAASLDVVYGMRYLHVLGSEGL